MLPGQRRRVGPGCGILGGEILGYVWGYGGACGAGGCVRAKGHVWGQTGDIGTRIQRGEGICGAVGWDMGVCMEERVAVGHGGSCGAWGAAVGLP